MAGKPRKGGEGTGAQEPKKARSGRSADAMKESPTDGDGAAGRSSRRAKSDDGRSGTAATGGRTRRGSTSGDAALRRELRDFASAHPEGWNHDEWNGLLGRLSESGYDTGSPEEIGRQLERERLALRLEGVQGVGPARVKKLAEEFGNLWQLRHADPDRIAAAGGVKREVAERIQESIR